MPRRKTRRTNASSVLVQMKKQAQAILITLRREIRAKEEELQDLKGQASSLQRLAGGGGARRAVATPRAAGGMRTQGGRINWSAVLSQLPKQFRARDIRAVPGIKSKRPSEIFAAITRWIEAGTVKRKSRGIYERA